MNNFDLVQKAYDEYVAEGKVFATGNQEEVEKQKGMVTLRAGYYINQVDPTCGILEKTSGNNYLGFSVDILIHTNGTFFDCMTDVDTGSGLRLVTPVNAGPNSDPSLIPRWRQPTKELAGLNGTPIPEPDPNPAIIALLIDMDHKLDVLLAKQAQQDLILAAILNKPNPIYTGRVPLFGGNVTLTPVQQ